MRDPEFQKLGTRLAPRCKTHISIQPCLFEGSRFRNDRILFMKKEYIQPSGSGQFFMFHDFTMTIINFQSLWELCTSAHTLDRNILFN